MSEPALKWISCTRTDVGRVRKVNEDSLLDRAAVGLWAVADGMGGHAAGDVASQLIIKKLDQITARTNTKLSILVNNVEQAILDANEQLLKLGKDTKKTSGSTVVVLAARNDYAICIWAGDSRLYRLRSGDLKQLTTDHSHAELYVEEGLMSRKDAAKHPSANMVTRAVGVDEKLHLEMDMLQLTLGDRFLLCTDGLDKHLDLHEIQRILDLGSVEDAADSLIKQTLANGAIDNVTVSVIDFFAADGMPPAADQDKTVRG